MASINYAAREINVKIVYYGPGLSGKTTNLQVIHRKVPPEFKSDMVSLATETDRTLFFDFLPLDLGKIKGFATKFQLYTVPGQVYYNATRKLVLRGVDGVVFVADSAQDKIQENIESFQNLEDNLAEYGYKRESIPIIIQYNKRDLPNALSVEELHQYINKYNLPWSEAVANKGIGVFDSLKLIGKIVIDYLNKKYSRGPRSSAAPTPAQPQQLPPVKQPQQQPQSSPVYNQLGQRPQVQNRPPCQGCGAGVQPQRPVFQQQPMRPPTLPSSQMPINRTSGPRPPQQQPVRQPQRPQGNSAQTEPQSFEPMQAPPAAARPRMRPSTAAAAVPAEEYHDQITFEPASNNMQPSPRQQPGEPAAQEEYYSYGSINLEPMDTLRQPGMAAPQQQHYDAMYDQPQAMPPQQGEYDSSGKTDLDLEIERYQHEIEEKQRRTRGPGGQAQGPGPQGPQPYSPPQMPQQPQPRNAVNQGTPQQDYEVYNMEAPSYGNQQQQQPVQPMIGNNEEEEMFFTSVDTDRQKKPIKRPVNPRTQQQKGFLSKFFNKDMT